MNFNPNGETTMPTTTNSLVAKAKRLAVPAGILATLLFALAFLFDHNRAHCRRRSRPARRLERFVSGLAR